MGKAGNNLWDAVSDGSKETKGVRNGIHKVGNGYGYRQPQDGKKEEKVTNWKMYRAVEHGSTAKQDMGTVVSRTVVREKLSARKTINKKSASEESQGTV